MAVKNIKSVAVIGAGPGGAITIDALAKEEAFDVIRVFERRERAGGCWVGGSEQRPPTITSLAELADRTADTVPLPIPDELPTYTPKSLQPRFSESSIYPYLETNVDHVAMEFTQEPIGSETSKRSVKLYGPGTPFRPWTVIREYIEGLIQRNGYEDFVSYSTTVERAEKIGDKWKVTLRKDGSQHDYWWVEWFDAVVVASGHYSVPYIPYTEGLEEFEKKRPGSVVHSKHFRGRDAYKNKRVVVVGASVSAADIAFDLVNVTQQPVYAVTVGHNFNGYFGDEAFKHPGIVNKPSVVKIVGREVFFKDGDSVKNVDHIIFGTGFTWTLPFLPSVPTRNNRVPELYQHVVWQHDPTLLFVGAVQAGLTFKIFEWQAVYAARVLSGRGTVPSAEEMQKWESDRVKVRGDGPKFAFVFPDFEDYFEGLKKLAGDGDGVGRPLPKFQRSWFRSFMDGHELRKNMWKTLNEEARSRRSLDTTQEIKYHL